MKMKMKMVIFGTTITNDKILGSSVFRFSFFKLCYKTVILQLSTIRPLIKSATRDGKRRVGRPSDAGCGKQKALGQVYVQQWTFSSHDDNNNGLLWLRKLIAIK